MFQRTKVRLQCESENCVRELEEKILKINQDPAGAGAGRQHMCRQKSVSLAQGTCEEPLRPRFAAELKVSSDKQRICHNYGGVRVPT